MNKFYKLTRLTVSYLTLLKVEIIDKNYAYMYKKK